MGELRLVPEAELGDLGPKQGEAIPFEWKWSYSAPALLVWLALILALVLPRANRDLRVLWIFVPLALVAAVYLFLAVVILFTPKVEPPETSYWPDPQHSGEDLSSLDM